MDSSRAINFIFDLSFILKIANLACFEKHHFMQSVLRYDALCSVTLELLGN
jgi:hypothetical protein